MKVTVSVLGRFHAFYLARELERHQSLARLITSYPKWAAARWNVPKDRISSLWPVEVSRRVIPSSLLRQLGAWGTQQNLYDTFAARKISGDEDIVVAWSGSAEKTLHRARKQGARVVVERGSAHIRTQRRILREEFSRHGIDPDVPSNQVVEKEEREYELADCIGIPSAFVERTFIEKGFPPKKLMRVPYGVDPDEFRPIPKEDDVFRVVFAGSIGIQKGIHYLLKAFDEANLPNSELLLLGKARGEAGPWLREYGQGVRHPGHIPQKELYRWYSQGSVFVLPSVQEGMAMVQLQAMVCGLPLVCTTNTGGEDLIREGQEGFVIPIRDVQALRERLEWCYKHQEECREMGRAARRRVLKEFTWRDYGNRIVRAYRNLRSSSASGDA